MNQLLSRQHLYSHSQENKQVRQASIVLLHTMRVTVKVALLGAVALLVAAIISSCSGTGGPTSTPTPILPPTSTLVPSPTATPSPPVATPTVPPGAVFWGDTLAPGY